MIKFVAGMKYQLAQDFEIHTPITGEAIDDQFFTLYRDGFLRVRKGFAWDGASGPTLDTKNSMSASLVHDVLCIMMRDRRLSYARWQDITNLFFEEMCIRAGMWRWRSRLWYLAVEFADAGNPNQGPDRLIQLAP